ncbi:MAG: hypothetical protein B7Z74_04845 [Deltaproteobacteria bacterium 21-66-5]|nr:MAG: hypothetical protein B7Z74_04845 [Deltaproteobacteria bacterium 21-66-5]
MYRNTTDPFAPNTALPGTGPLNTGVPADPTFTRLTGVTLTAVATPAPALLTVTANVNNCPTDSTPGLNTTDVTVNAAAACTVTPKPDVTGPAVADTALADALKLAVPAAWYVYTYVKSAVPDPARLATTPGTGPDTSTLGDRLVPADVAVTSCAVTNAFVFVTANTAVTA